MSDEHPPIPNVDLERVRRALHVATTADLVATAASHRRRRLRMFVVVVVGCLAVVSAAMAGQALLGGRTSSSLDETARSPSIRASFAKLLTDPAVTQGTTLGPDTPIRKVFDLPSDSAYAGHSVYAAEAAGGWVCVKALDAAGCGRLTRSTPIVGVIIGHPGSNLPGLAFGVIASDVTGVAFRCRAATHHASIIGTNGYALVLGRRTSVDGCAIVASFADGHTVQVDDARG